MKVLATTVLILLAATDSRAEAGLKNKVPGVPVYVRYNPAEPPVQILTRAECLASRMFAATDVHVIWHAGTRAAVPGETPISIEMALNTPETAHRGALAYSEVFDAAHIIVFWDRLRGTPDSALRTGLLAHVLVHEITHVLQGTNHHSEEGIMKAHWTREDIEQMASEPLPFDLEDVRLIRLGLAARNSATRRVLPDAYRLH